MEPKTPHIIREFDDAFGKLGKTVSVMASQCLLNLERAITGLMKRDIDLCRAVIADDNDIDEAERNIDAFGLEILVRFHPVASDLRKVITSMKMAANLERISDHAVNSSKRARKMLNKPEIPETQLVEPVYKLADRLLRDALVSFTDLDASLGASLRERDQEIDRAHKRVIATLSERIEEGGELTEAYLHLIFVVRSLERIGDLAVNIGEDAVFLDRAEDIRYTKSRSGQIAAEDDEDDS